MKEKYNGASKYMFTSNPLGNVAICGGFSNEPCGTQSDVTDNHKYLF